jgi:hypothetical protein
MNNATCSICGMQRLQPLSDLVWHVGRILVVRNPLLVDIE